MSCAGGKTICSQDYVLEITISNVYFHLSMAYALLRHHGVDGGKMAFLGRITWTKA